ncbi:hypothetical protein ACGF3G_00405 [Streptomyces sp. NPDC048179]|uniref:hypothetical protein n=1 Tax=Streptomyces sp. NPDC048179 TaxID=3365506 RepID=UPI003721EEC8
MAALLGTHVPIDCPVCPDTVVDVPVRETAVGPGETEAGTIPDLVVTISVDLSSWRRHIADAHTATSRKAS